MSDTVASPELTGGAGFTFEDVCAAVYLAALLGEETAPGLPDRTVVGVAVQQAPSGRPLDDLVVTGRAQDGSEASLDLQIKHSLVASAAPSNRDFRSVVARVWDTIKAPTFRSDRDRAGVITGQIAVGPRRALETISEWARSTSDAPAFLRCFAGGTANETHRKIRDAVGTILTEQDATFGDDTLHKFFRHFVLVTFDFLHEGSTSRASGVTFLRTLLADSDKGRAEDLSHRLQRVARDAAGRGAVFDRGTLLSQLHGSFRLAGAVSLRADLSLVAENTSRALSEIENTIDGLRLLRPKVDAAIAAAVNEHRYVQVTGLPGTGKSAALRAFAEKCAANGPVLLLKADRLDGPSWASYATSLGLVSSHLKPLLQEIAAVGTPILFIDGLDRVEVQNRGIVNDILNALAADPELATWHVVATVRDNGIEPLRTWLSPNWSRNGTATVDIPSFDDDEALEIATQRPALHPLLFGDEKLRELARRPFFLSALSHLPTARSVRSEVDLVEAWWNQGGYNAPPETAGHLQRALIAFARDGALTLGRRISSAQADPTSIAKLRADGVIRDVRPGHAVAFAHDIYFEWAFLHLLIEADADWPSTLRSVGEPPALGRVVELLSQSVLLTRQDWGAHLVAIDASELRPQWRRAWLLGPFNLPTFSDFAATYSAVVLKPEANRLASITVWMQAEKTRANPRVLDGTLGITGTSRELVRIADIAAWPADIALWTRFLDWLLALDSQIPHAIIPDVVSAFEVWQNLWAGTCNRISARILDLCETWLCDLEDRLHPDEFRFDHGPWKFSSDALSQIETRLRAIVLRAARAYAVRVKTYLERVTQRERLRTVAFEQIVSHAQILAEQHASLLRALTLAEVLNDLPSVVAARPPDPGELGIRDISYHDWSELAIGSQSHVFYPPAPTREPFAALFAKAPGEARQLVREIVNHAIAAWRELHTLDPQRPGTPVPLILEFPWGTQTFWGDLRVYGWFRGASAPAPVECALMALEQWAFAEIDHGRNVDDVIRDVVEGQNCSAVLGIAIALALTVQKATAGSLPLVGSQRLWAWDIGRMIQDRTLHPNVIGFSTHELDQHYEAVKSGNERACRRDELRSLAMLFVLSNDAKLSEAARAAIADFPNQLPFDVEEQRNEPALLAKLRRTAEIWAEVANPDTYKVYRTQQGDGYLIQHESPKAKDADVVAVVERQRRQAERWNLLSWALKRFETGAIGSQLTVPEAISRARALDDPKLFAEADDDSGLGDLRRNAVAGVAAVVLTFGDPEDKVAREWAADVTNRGSRNIESVDGMFFAGSILSYHPCIFAAKGLAALIKGGLDVRRAQEALLGLAAHPYEQVSEAALAEAMGCWQASPQYAWAALNLGIALSIGSWAPGRISAYGYDHTSNAARTGRAVDSAIAAAFADEPPLSTVAIPAPWAKTSPTGARRRPHLSSRGWRESDEFLRWDFLPRVIKHVPIDLVMADPLRAPVFIGLCKELVSWTIQRIKPPWLEEEKRGRTDRSTEVLEWRGHLYRFLAKVALHVEVGMVADAFLVPAFALDDEEALSLIRPFADTIVCAGIFDPPSVAPQAPPLLEHCLTRVLTMRAWDSASWNDGRIFGYDLPELIRVFLFVQVKHAAGAARFANGDWKDIQVILPIIDSFVRAVGQIPNVMSAFLTLCERSIDHYPVETFVDQCTAVLAKQQGTPLGWHGTTLPGRIAALIYEFAERAQPLENSVAQHMLRILDNLVDMGDRRSAALQTSELFKEVRSVN